MNLQFSKSQNHFRRFLAKLGFSFIIILSFSAKAAIEETLKLPAKNRASILKTASSGVYSEMREIAFSKNYPMSLRWRAVMGMAEARKGKALPELLLAADDNEWFIRNAALIALTHAAPTQAVQTAKKLLLDKALVVRSAAVEVIQVDLNLGNRDLLWEQLENRINFKREQSLWIRPQIVEALAKEPRSNEVRMFARLLHDQDLKIQEFAIKGLENATGKKIGSGKISRSKLVALWIREMAL